MSSITSKYRLHDYITSADSYAEDRFAYFQPLFNELMHNKDMRLLRTMSIYLFISVRMKQYGKPGISLYRYRTEAFLKEIKLSVCISKAI